MAQPAAILFGLQLLLFLVDEFAFHRKRGLSGAERWGYPLDLLSIIMGLSFPLFIPYTNSTKLAFGIVFLLSLFIVTKDTIRNRSCTGGEHWVHAWLFMLHPLVLILAGASWVLLRGSIGALVPVDTRHLRLVVGIQAGALALLAVFQILRWNLMRSTVPTVAAPSPQQPVASS
ncbi:MAG: hypothetical protein ACXWPM_10810 [Bdellovibrionota bacterium]